MLEGAGASSHHNMWTEQKTIFWKEERSIWRNGIFKGEATTNDAMMPMGVHLWRNPCYYICQARSINFFLEKHFILEISCVFEQKVLYKVIFYLPLV